MPEGAGRAWVAVPLVILSLLVGASCAGVVGSARGAGYPTVPLADDRSFVEGVTGAELASGGSGAIGLEVHNPLSAPLASVMLTVGVYAFSAFPGNASGPVDVSSAPVLSNATASALQVEEAVPSLAPNQSRPLSIPVQTAASTPAGTFAVRFALEFRENGTLYNLSSRGWFSASQWAAATSGPNGSVQLNLSALGVSGVLPETSVLVSSSGFADLLWAILGAGVVVVGVGAWLYFRRSNSRSGTRPSAEATQAPRAFGSSRTRDGD